MQLTDCYDPQEVRDLPTWEKLLLIAETPEGETHRARLREILQHQRQALLDWTVYSYENGHQVTEEDQAVIDVRDTEAVLDWSDRKRHSIKVADQRDAQW